MGDSDFDLILDHENQKAAFIGKNLSFAVRKQKRKPIHNNQSSLRARVYQRDGMKCLKCGEPDFELLTMDHIKPIAKGGKHTFENIQTLCEKCNGEKGIKIIDYRK